MLIELTPSGLYCSAGDFYIDPQAPVRRAIITHAHTDHAKPGSDAYLTSRSGKPLVQQRVGLRAKVESLEFGEEIEIRGVKVSLHPAGHILGSTQVRIEYHGEIWVVSGDYKLEPDATCETFEHVKCHTFITESTFAKPHYKWKAQTEIFNQINDWWQMNSLWGTTSLIGAYSLGKAQRVLAGLDPGIGPIMVYPTVEKFLPAYKAAGISFPEILPFNETTIAEIREKRPLIIAPPQFARVDAEKKFGAVASAFASGWMSKGGLHSKIHDRGFALSDHADWEGLLAAIKATEAENIFVMHGFTNTLVNHLRSIGYNAHVIGATQRVQPAAEHSLPE
ncbi:MAG: ligase-associated DNA damage response exonuclease [Bacteroidota bacterium]|nr:ligase-associated DNA damage response exonuclease [Bacteroidota bacterium]MDP4230944.1 ligase-associated DNA damage response exonuclease [Bacteroidota bacterium]MDP4237778.1 ligase-associated DNA damage response exonuclease [Bacteroidota bacterium]